MSLVVGITGASGGIYALELLKSLEDEVYLVLSENGEKIMEYECGVNSATLKELAKVQYDNDDLSADISSGSVNFDGMVIVPCSMTTMSKIAVGIGDNLITRVASVCLKEKRELVLVVRETPLRAVHLENMAKLAAEGATVLPAMPGFYHKPESLDDIIDFMVGKIMDALGIENEKYTRWKSE